MKAAVKIENGALYFSVSGDMILKTNVKCYNIFKSFCTNLRIRGRHGTDKRS